MGYGDIIDFKTNTKGGFDAFIRETPWQHNIATFATDANGNPIGLSTGSGVIPIDQSGLFNFNPAKYQNTRAAFAAMKNGTSNLQALCLGDSTTAGTNPAGGADASNSWCAKLSQQLARQGYYGGTAPTSAQLGSMGWQNVFGDHGAATPVTGLTTYDARVTGMTGWSVFGTAGTFMGNNLLWSTSTTNPLTFTPTQPTDTIDVWYVDNGAAYATVSILGGAAGATTPTTLINNVPSGSNTIKKATATFTGGSTVWTIKAGSAATMFILGFNSYNAATTEVSLINCGIQGLRGASGSYPNTQNGSCFAPNTTYYQNLNPAYGNSSALISPLAIIMLGINDAGNTAAAAYYAGIAATITALQSSGKTDVLLVNSYGLPAASQTLLAQEAILAAANYQLAATFGVALVDIPARWGIQATSTYVGADNIHPTLTVGYPDIGAAIGQFFKRL